MRLSIIISKFKFVPFILILFSCQTSRNKQNADLLDFPFVYDQVLLNNDCKDAFIDLLKNFNYETDISISDIYKIKVHLDTAIHGEQTQLYENDNFIYFGIKTIDSTKQTNFDIIALNPPHSSVYPCMIINKERLVIPPIFQAVGDFTFLFKNDCFQEVNFNYSKPDSNIFGIWRYSGIKSFKGKYVLIDNYNIKTKYLNGDWIFNNNTISINDIKGYYKIDNGEFVIKLNESVDTFNLLKQTSEDLILLDNDNEVIKLKNYGP